MLAFLDYWPIILNLLKFIFVRNNMLRSFDHQHDMFFDIFIFIPSLIYFEEAADMFTIVSEVAI